MVMEKVEQGRLSPFLVNVRFHLCPLHPKVLGQQLDQPGGEGLLRSAQCEQGLHGVALAPVARDIVENQLLQLHKVIQGLWHCKLKEIFLVQSDTPQLLEERFLYRDCCVKITVLMLSHFFKSINTDASSNMAKAGQPYDVPSS